MAKRQTRRPAPQRKRPRTRKPKVAAKTDHLTVMDVAELDDLRQQLQRTARAQAPLRWNADPDDVQRSVAKLVLTLVEFVRQLLERQSIRQVEDVGRALMQLEETVRDIAAKFGIPPEDLNLELGPLGKLI